MNIFSIFDYLSTFVFAFNGTKAYLNSTKNVNILAAIFFGIMTAVGGGTIRDTLTNVPIFWMKNPIYILFSLVFSVLALYYYKIIFTYHH